MGSNGASGASRYRPRAETEASEATITDIHRITEHAGSQITKPATQIPLRPEHDESKSSVHDLPDHIRRFCQRFFFSDDRSLF
jgi:hypothetical protein